MDIKITNETLQLSIFGLEGIIESQDYASLGLQLSGKVWHAVKTMKLKNKGKNIWVYETGNRMFAGVQLESPSEKEDHGLIEKNIKLKRYTSFEHIGPYSLIRNTVQTMREKLENQGFSLSFPLIEIYDHWTGDENTTKTDLLINLV